VTVFVLSVGVLALGAVALMLARASSPTRSVHQVLHDTEHPGAGSR
jgi:hypothetical protein